MFSSEEYEYILADVKEYLHTRFELGKLALLNKLSRIVGLLLFGLTLILIIFAILAAGGVALIFALSNCMPTWAAALIVGAIWIVIAVLVIALRKHLFINPALMAIAAILFSDQPHRPMTLQSVEHDQEIYRIKADEQQKNLQRQADRMERSWMSLLARLTSIRDLFGSLLGKLFRR